MKRRSGSKPARSPELFIDRSLGKYDVAEPLRAAGATVHCHDDLFDRQTADHDWIGDATRNGWVILTGDKDICYNQLAMSEIRAAEARVFIFITRKDFTGPEIGAVFAKWLPKIGRLARNEPAPFIAKVKIGETVEVYRTRTDILGGGNLERHGRS